MLFILSIILDVVCQLNFMISNLDTVIPLEFLLPSSSSTLSSCRNFNLIFSSPQVFVSRLASGSPCYTGLWLWSSRWAFLRSVSFISWIYILSIGIAVFLKILWKKMLVNLEKPGKLTDFNYTWCNFNHLTWLMFINRHLQNWFVLVLQRLEVFNFVNRQIIYRYTSS